MRQIAIVLVALLAAPLNAGVAIADPHDGYQQRYAWGTKHGKNGGYKHEDRGPGYRYEYKPTRHGHYETEYKVKGGPPPWAPAHGYRRKHGSHDHHHATDTVELPRPAIDLSLGRCHRDIIGGAIGAAAGAAIGSTIGDGDERRAAIAAGAVIGTIVGGVIGRTMDQADQACVGRTLEYAEDGQAIEWTSPEQGTYQVVPTRTYQVGTGHTAASTRRRPRLEARSNASMVGHVGSRTDPGNSSAEGVGLIRHGQDPDQARRRGLTSAQRGGMHISADLSRCCGQPWLHRIR